MKFLFRHWYDIGAFLALLTGIYIFINVDSLNNYKLIMWASLISLFLHQLEEYRIIGTFPGMVNKILFNSTLPDRFPLNAKTAFYVNVVVGWGSYFLASIYAEKAIWLGIATILVSAGNTIGHTLLFNIKGKTIYNAGLITCWLFFVPISYYFFRTIITENLASTTDYTIGIVLGIALNYFGILKLIDWMANKNTTFIFPKRNLLPKDRN